jgi:hypothetical protein
MSNDSEARIQQAIAAARTGKRDEARQILLKVVRADSENIRAWLLLARVTTDPSEKRTALNNVIELEPDNQQANQMLAQLAISGVFSEENESAVRTGNSMRRIIIGAMGVMILIIVGIIVLVLSRGNEQSAANSTATVASGNLTQVAAISTQNAQGTQIAEAETAAAFALIPTETPTPRPVLPTETLTPTITLIPSLTPISAPQGLQGVIIGWGGSNALNDGYFPVVQLALDGSGTITELSGTNRGGLVAAYNRSRVIYTRYFRDLFENYLGMIDVGTGQQENMAFRFDDRSSQQFIRATTPQITPDGRLLVFVAEAGAREIRQIYLFDFNAPVGTDAIRRLTNDEFDYDFPAISPDGTKVIAVRRGRAPEPPKTDLVLIDLTQSSQMITDWTTDGDTNVETHPRWSPDGKLVAYVSGTQSDPKGDIFVRTISDAPTSFNVTRSPGVDDIFPVFSPDSRYLAYSSDVQSEEFRISYNIFIYDLIDGLLYQVTRDDERYYPGAWIE